MYPSIGPLVHHAFVKTVENGLFVDFKGITAPTQLYATDGRVSGLVYRDARTHLNKYPRVQQMRLRAHFRLLNTFIHL